jgi:hypothetical protein
VYAAPWEINTALPQSTVQRGGRAEASSPGWRRACELVAAADPAGSCLTLMFMPSAAQLVVSSGAAQPSRQASKTGSGRSVQDLLWQERSASSGQRRGTGLAALGAAGPGALPGASLPRAAWPWQARCRPAGRSPRGARGCVEQTCRSRTTCRKETERISPAVAWSTPYLRRTGTAVPPYHGADGKAPIASMQDGEMAGEARWAGEDQLMRKTGVAARRDEGSAAGSDERPTQPSTHLCRSQWRFKDPKSPPASTVALTAGGAAWGRGGSKTQRHTCCRGMKPTAGGRRTIAAVRSGAHLQVRRRRGGFRPG